MINISLIEKCNKCYKDCMVDKVYVSDESEEQYLVKEYICECGNKNIHSEVLNFVIM